MTTNIGTPDYVDGILAEYVPPDAQPADALERLLQNETDALLYAVLTELRASRMSRGDEQSIQVLLEQQRQTTESDPTARATYRSITEAVPNSEWTEFDLEFVAGEVDVRADDGVDVAFADPSKDKHVVHYGTSDLPVTGINARTSKIWVNGQGTDADTNIHIEAWGDA